MKKYIKYILITALLVTSVSLFPGISDRIGEVFLQNLENISLPSADTLPRYPVKKTQITTYKDLEKRPPIDLKDPSNVETKIDYDSNSKFYIFRTKIGDQYISTPFSMSMDEYMDYTLKQSMSSYFKKKNETAFENKDEKDEFSLKDVNVNLGPAEKIFGPGGVRIQTQGYVEATMGMKHTSVDNPTLSEKNRSRTAFDFDEDIQLNVNASVGDKINFGMNYDTKSMFDFDSKKLKLAYEGKEDEIIRSIEAGNVSMTTTNSLINGGTALFGIRTELQFGKLRINTVISQQESESQTVSAKGGVQTNNFEFKSDQYDENRHFFLAHYFRDNYDRVMSNLSNVQSRVNITNVEVWITNKRADYTQSRNIVAFADIAERDSIRRSTKWTGSGALKEPYNEANNLHATIANGAGYKLARDIKQVTGLFEGQGLVNGLDYEKVESARLLNSSEYHLNPQLGYISLTSALQADEVLAVAYEYAMGGKSYQVGEFSTQIVDKYDPNNPASGSLYVRLLKPVSLSPISYTWNLMMKNVYSIGANNIQQDKFRLNISYQSDTIGTYVNYIPEGILKDSILLRVMGMDRLNTQKRRDPDGIFDYIEGYTVRSDNGRIYFPVVEPFGSHLRKKIGNAAIADKYVYDQLYNDTKTAAQQIAEKNKFKMYGSFRGSASNAEIDLNATNIPRGSVRITAGGVSLTEGVDYIVDYSAGIATLINQDILDSNTPVQASLENQTFSMQRKTLMGMNLSYDISKDFSVGGTIMHLYEKPLTMKTQIGSESVKNTLWGLNTSFRTESQWLTDLVDKIPLIDATQPSQISFTGEFAQLIGGHYESKDVGKYSYLDDFESSQSRIDLKSPYSWSLAATPKRFQGATPTDTIGVGKKRAMLAWYMIDGMFTRKNSSLTPQHIKNDRDQLSDHRVREVYLREIYPNRDANYTESSTIQTLNLSYYPTERGPYNLDSNVDRDGKFTDPQNRWAGITRKMDTRDFETSNIEYIEFWLMDPFVEGKNLADTGRLVFNLGEISEDILKDGKKFYENGLPINDDDKAYELTKWGKVPTRQSTVYAFDDSKGAEGRRKQDVGLNGLSVEEEKTYPAYKTYLNALEPNLAPNVLAEMKDPGNLFSPFNAPANDLYHSYRGADYDRDEVNILTRYKYYNNTEGNSVSTGDTNESYSTAARSTPDVEDIDQDNTLNETESYFRYDVELNQSKMKVGQNHIVDARTVKVPLRNGLEGEVTWYQFKIPIRDKKTPEEGTIRDFKSIRFMRMYLTGFHDSMHLRFGTLQLVRGDWRAYDPSLNKNEADPGTGVLEVSTVNIEENGDRKPVNYVLPPGLSRSLDADQTQTIKENEQALSLKVTGLSAENAKAIYKSFAQDLRRYKRLQLFTHAEELVGGPRLAKGELTVFLRLGSDYKNNYYEYEIPLSVTMPGNYGSSESDRSLVWPQENMFDFPLDVLTNLKLKRNAEKRKGGSQINYTTLFSEYDPEKPTNKISVIGNPSLSDVNVIMIGVRNNSRADKSGEVWVNELRLTDFDDKGGWAAQGNLNIALSDLGTFNFSGRKETVGFGALDQSMIERRADDYYMYNIAASVELGKFFPEKAKVSVPLYYSYSNQTSTPEYDPYDQDITLHEALSIVSTRAEKDSIKRLAQEKTVTKSFSLNNIRVNIQSKTPMPYDPANFTVGYAFNQTEYRNPSTEYDITQNYKATFGYSYSPLVKTWEPFKKTKSKSGAAKFAKSLGFNYLPNNIAFNSNINRYYTETSLRDLDSYQVGGTNNSKFLSYSHSFFWDRDFSINWDFTKNLKFSFQSGTRAEIEAPFLQVNKKLNRTDYDEWKEAVMNSITHLGTPFTYKQIATVSYQVPFRNIPAMNWVTSNISYTSGYQWDRGADDTDMGNTIGNNVTLDFKNRLNMVSLYNKSDFLKRVNQRFDGKKSTQNQSQQKEPKKETPKKRVTKDIVLNVDEPVVVEHGLGTKKIDVIGKKDGKTYKLTYKRIDDNSIRITNKDTVGIQVNILDKRKAPGENVWVDVAEYSARGLMSLRTLSFNYSKRNETHISGYRPYIGDAFGQGRTGSGAAPGLGFAFGLDGGEDFLEKSFDKHHLVIKDESLTPAIFNNATKFEARAQLEPFKGLKVELNVNREDNRRTELQYYSAADAKPMRTLGGSFSMTTVALATSLRGSNAKNDYHSEAFEQFLKNRSEIKSRFDDKYKSLNNSSLNEMNINSADVLIPSFISAYTGKSAKSVSLSAFPSLLAILPNWSVAYDGLIEIPAIKEKFKSIRINHAYTCFYQVGSYTSFTSWTPASGSDDLGYIRDALNGSSIPSSPYNIGSVGISEIFNPLFGAEGVLNNNMSVNAQYNNMRTLNLNMTSYQIIESTQKEIVVGLGYRINEFNRVIGLSDKNSAGGFNNDLNIKANLSHKTAQALLRKIEEQFTQATSGTTIVTIKLSADYAMSRALTVRAFFDRILNKPLITSVGYPTTNSNFGISFKFTLVQ